MPVAHQLEQLTQCFKEYGIVVQNPGGLKIDINELKEIHFKETGEMLSYEEVLEVGTRLLSLLKIIGKKIPEESE